MSSTAVTKLKARLEAEGISGDFHDTLIELLQAAETGVAEIQGLKHVLDGVNKNFKIDLHSRLEDIRTGKEGPVSENIAVGVGAARQVVGEVASGRGDHAINQILKAIRNIEQLEAGPT